MNKDEIETKNSKTVGHSEGAVDKISEWVTSCGTGVRVKLKDVVIHDLHLKCSV